MRITGHRMLEMAAAAAARAQSEVAETSGQLTSGKRVDRASDDPLAWAQARRAEVRRAASEGRGEALGLGKDHLAETERALSTIGAIVAESQQLAVQAANDSVGAAERAAIGVRVAGLFQSALAAANTRTTAGEYVLAGSGGTTAPFDATGAYLGDGLTRALELDGTSTTTATLAGEHLTAVHGVDVLPMLRQFAAALAGNDPAAIRQAVGDLALAHDQLTRARADAGAMYAVLDEADRSRGALEDALGSQIAALVETDLIGAAGELSRRIGALTAAEAVNAKLAALLAPAR